jgi:hypothetical protein
MCLDKVGSRGLGPPHELPLSDTVSFRGALLQTPTWRLVSNL